MLNKVHTHIDKHFSEHLESAREFLRIPSVSNSQPGLGNAAEWLGARIKALGGNVQTYGKPEAPVIIARFDSNQPKTLLVYGMYDVQPVDGQSWSSPPFGANIETIPDIGQAVIARGACNSKGPLAGFLNVVQAFQESSELPVNLIMTIEGEEEVGSPTLPGFYQQNREWLIEKVDACFEPFWAEYGTDVGHPIVSLGSKGIISVELVCQGGEWGGPVQQSLHSSVGAWIHSPAWRLLKAVNTLIDDEENILVKDFNEDVLRPSPEEESVLAELGKTFDEKQTLQLMGARRYKFAATGVDLLRKYLFSPSIQVGALSHEGGDVIAARASIQLTIRLVPRMDPLGTVAKIRDHLDRLGYKDIEVNPLACYPYSKVDLREKVVQCMIETYRDHGIEPQVWPMLASATPYYLFSEILGKPFVWGGLGKAGRSHVADEYFSVEGLRSFEKSIATFLLKFAQA